MLLQLALAVATLAGLWLVTFAVCFGIGYISCARFDKRTAAWQDPVNPRRCEGPTPQLSRIGKAATLVTGPTMAVSEKAAFVIGQLFGRLITASAKRHTEFIEGTGDDIVVITHVGNGSFLWIKRQVSFQSVTFRRLKQGGPFADVWYHVTNAGDMTRDQAGNVLFSKAELLEFGSEIISTGPKTTLSGYGAAARYGTRWLLDLNRGIELQLMTPHIMGVYNVVVNIQPGSSIVSHGFAENPDETVETVDSDNLLGYLQKLLRQLEDRTPELAATVQAQLDAAAKADRRRQDALREQGLRS